MPFKNEMKKKINSPTCPHVESFLQYLELEKGRSKKTIAAYRLSLEKSRAIFPWKKFLWNW
jgi:site-specific recombinase XerD